MNQPSLLFAKQSLKSYFEDKRRYFQTNDHELFETAISHLKEATEILLILHQSGEEEATRLLFELDAKQHIKLPKSLHDDLVVASVSQPFYQRFISFLVCSCTSVFILTHFTFHLTHTNTTVDLLLPPTHDTQNVLTTAKLIKVTEHEPLLLVRNALSNYYCDHHMLPQSLNELTQGDHPYLKTIPLNPQTNEPFSYVPHHDSQLSSQDIIVESLQSATTHKNYYYSQLKLHLCLETNELIVADEHYIYYVFKLQSQAHTYDLDDASQHFLSYIMPTSIPLLTHQSHADFLHQFEKDPLYYHPEIKQNRYLIQSILHETNTYTAKDLAWFKTIEALYHMKEA